MSTADLVFGGCLLLGGGLLLLTLIFDDLFGGFLNAIHFGLDLGGVSPTPVLLGFVAMFGVGGLLGIHGFGVGVGLATLIGVVAGVIGAGGGVGGVQGPGGAPATRPVRPQGIGGSSRPPPVGVPAHPFRRGLFTFAGPPPH